MDSLRDCLPRFWKSGFPDYDQTVKSYMVLYARGFDGNRLHAMRQHGCIKIIVQAFPVLPTGPPSKKKEVESYRHIDPSLVTIVEQNSHAPFVALSCRVFPFPGVHVLQSASSSCLPFQFVRI